MSENVKDLMIEAGFDYENTVYRFLGNEQMYHKFLKKLLEDTCFAEILEGIARKSASDVFSAAHTLKGVAANLGITPVQQLSSQITEATRDKADADVDFAQIESMATELEKIYQRSCELIAML